MFDDATIKSLAEDNPLGFFVFDLDRFDNNYNTFLNAFRNIYPHTRIAYSYKTNYLPLLCKRNDQFGGYAEVVSRMEYDLALRLGVSGQNIIFNGPVKTKEDYLAASKLGSIVNIDSEYEIDLIEELSRENDDLNLHLGIRCAVNLPDMTPSRFGFDIDDAGFMDKINRLKQISNVQLDGLHCHTIPPGRTPKNYATIARRLLQMGRKIWGSDGPHFIDMGGGYFSNMDPNLRDQFDVDIPSFDDYGEAIAQEFALFTQSGNCPELILEPGLAIAADCFKFICRIIDIKQNNSKKYALVAGSVYNVRPTKSHRNLPIRRIPLTASLDSKEHLSADIVGYTCMEDDVLHRNYSGPLEAGDLLVFDNVGAYTLVLKPPFIQCNVPVFGYSKGITDHITIKRSETLDDIMATYLHEWPDNWDMEENPHQLQQKDGS